MALLSRKASTVALDIGSSYVKLLELERERNGKYRLKNFGIAALPPEAIVDGAFMNTTAIVSTIKELLAKNKVKTKDAVVAISGNSVIIKRISLPVMTQDEMEESLPWEAEQYIPFDVNDVNLDAHVLQGKADEAGQMDVLLVAARKELVNEYTSVVMEAGLRPVVIDVAAFAMENMFNLNYDNPGELVALVNVGAGVVNLNVLRRGVSTFTRDIGMGGRAYTEEIQRALNISYEEAEAFKTGGGSERDRAAVVPEEVERVLSAVSDNIAGEVHRSLDFYLSTAGGGNLSYLYIAGGAAGTPGLKSALERFCGCPVEVVDPFRRIVIDERGFQPGYLRDTAPQAGVAVGLALRYMDDNRAPPVKGESRSIIRVNLLPIRQTRKAEAIRRDLLLGGVGAGITVGVALALWGVFQIQLSAVQGQTKALEAAINQAATDVAAVEELETMEKDLQTKLQVIGALRAQKTGPVHMLDDLATATPDKVQLVSLTQKGDQIEVKGTSVSNEVISQFLRNLDKTESFEAVFLQDIEASKLKGAAAANGVLLKDFKLTSRLTTQKVEEAKKDPKKPEGAAPAAPAPGGSGT